MVRAVAYGAEDLGSNHALTKKNFTPIANRLFYYLCLTVQLSLHYIGPSFSSKILGKVVQMLTVFTYISVLSYVHKSPEGPSPSVIMLLENKKCLSPLISKRDFAIVYSSNEYSSQDIKT